MGELLQVVLSEGRPSWAHAREALRLMLEVPLPLALKLGLPIPEYM